MTAFGESILVNGQLLFPVELDLVSTPEHAHSQPLLSPPRMLPLTFRLAFYYLCIFSLWGYPSLETRLDV